jgi:prophage maintenance system killer protein
MSKARSFLRKNGVYFSKDDGLLYQAMMAIAEKRLDKNGLAAVLKQQAEK